MTTAERHALIIQSKEEDVEENSDSEPRIYRRRWAALAVFFLLAVASNGINLTFGTIDKIAGQCFKKPQITINLMSGTAAVSGAFLLLPSLILIKKIGLQKAIWGLAAFQIFCGILRIVTPLSLTILDSGPYFWLIFASQLCVALPVAFLTSLPVQLSTNYFPASERSLATSIASLAQIFGLAAGQTSGYIITNVNECPRFHWLFVAQGIFCLCTGVLGLFLRARPPSPPTEASKYGDSHEMSLWKELKHLLSVGSMRILLLIYACGMGTFVALWSSLQDIITDPIEAVNVSLIICGTGIVGGIVGGILLDKIQTPNIYKTLMMISALGGCSGMALFAFANYRGGMDALIMGSSAMIGFFLIGMTPVAFELAQELSFPVSSTTSTAVLLVVGNFVGIIYIVVFSIRKNRAIDLIIVFSIYAAVQVLLIFMRPILQRKKCEAEAATRRTMTLNLQKN